MEDPENAWLRELKPPDSDQSSFASGELTAGRWDLTRTLRKSCGLALLNLNLNMYRRQALQLQPDHEICSHGSTHFVNTGVLARPSTCKQFR
jgi:hypothetical protein